MNKVHKLLRRRSELDSAIDAAIQEEYPINSYLEFEYRSKKVTRGRVLMHGYGHRIRVQNISSGASYWIDIARVRP